MLTRQLLRRAAIAALAFEAQTTPVHAQPIWSLRANAPEGGKLVHDSARGVTYLFGGSETWEWDGRTWVLREPAAVAPGVVLAYDSIRGRTVCHCSTGTWEFDGSSWTMVASPSASPGFRLFLPGFAFDAARGRTVLFGGGNVADTWEWDGTSWTQLFPASSPNPNVDPVLAYDARRGVTVMYGGQSPDNVPRDQTWEWDGTNWTRRTGVGSPGWREAFQMLFDPARGRVVFIALSTHVPNLTETWEYDGVAWVRTSTTTALPPVAYPSIAADVARVRLVYTATTSQFETWEWDGSTWRQIGPPRPQTSNGYPGSLAVLCYDAGRERTVRYLGAGASSTWEWDGHVWIPITLQTIPTAGVVHGLAYDSARGVIVLCVDTRAGQLETWEWYRGDWALRAPPVPRPQAAGSAGAHVAFDSVRGLTVLYRGGSDLWEWDGTTWRQRLLAVFPSSSDSFSIAFDPVRARTVLVTRSSSPQTWEWDGQQWIRGLSAHTPPPCTSATIVYDAALGGVAAVGLADFPSCMQAWLWDGTDWSAIKLRDGSPIPAAVDGAAYDSGRDRTVVVERDRTWELGATAPSVDRSMGSEAGGDLVRITGFDATGPAETDVRFGLARAAVVDAGPNRILVRTPPGSGIADVVVSTSRLSSRLPGAFEYVPSWQAARFGNVNASSGAREDVLLVDGIAGDSRTRDIRLPVRTPLSVAMLAPSTRLRARFAVYAWLAPPGAADATVQPRGVGTTVFPTPLQVGASPQPFAIGNNLAARLGAATFGTTPAPSLIGRASRGVGRPLVFTMQGFIEDDGSAIPAHVSVTNAVIVNVTR
jgi:hypothetical protein